MTKVTDPNILAQLNEQTKVTDPNLLAQLEGQQPQETNSSWFGSRIPANIAIGFAEGGQALRNAPYNITRMFSPETAERMSKGRIGQALFAPQHNNFGPTFGINDPNILDKLIQEAAQYVPLASATGGAGLGRTIRGGAISGGLLSENPLIGSALGAGLGAIRLPLSKALKSMPSAYKAIKQGFRPTKTLEALNEGYTEKAIQPIVEQGKQQYTNSIGKFYNKPFSGTPELESILTENKEFIGPKINKFSKKLIKNSNLENADLLKRKLNEEIYDLAGKRAVGDTTVGDRLSVLQDLRESLKNQTVASLEQYSPEAAQACEAAEANWAQNVHPVRTLSSLLKNMSHKIDKTSAAAVKRTAEAILKEHVQNAANIPPEANIMTNKMIQQYKNAETLGKVIKYGGIAALIGGGGEATRRLLHLL